MRCPCRKKTDATAYDACCEPLHRGARHAETAEELMRSRYAAFALKQEAYLKATWHPATRPDKVSIPAQDEWMMLKIIAAREDGARATVEFKARWRFGGASNVMHEVSNFLREDGRWYYVDGVVQRPS